MSAPQLLQFLDRLSASGVHMAWSVVVAEGSSGPSAPHAVTLASGVSVVPVERATKPKLNPKWSDAAREDTITIGALASPTDLIGDLRDSEVTRLGSLPRGSLKVDPTEREHAARNRACRARDEDHCLLVLYAVQPVTVIPDPGKDREVRHYVELAEGSPLPIGLAIALPANEKVPPVSYLVNSVLIDELEEQYAADDRAEEAP